MIPDIDAFEERAAIAHHDGRLPWRIAQDLAAQRQGFVNSDAYWAWLADYVLRKRPPAFHRADVREGSVVVLKPIDDIPEHLFRVTEVIDDVLCGYSLTGPLAGEYGEPDFDLVDRLIWQAQL